jgi:4-hydroxy-tetrahydrodipicolinate synthase
MKIRMDSGQVGNPTNGAPEECRERRTASTYVISLTPFTESGDLDSDGLRGHFRRLADAGIGVYVAGSGSGEAYTLSDAELRTVLRVASEELAGRVPVRGMGREPRTAAEMIAFGRMVEEAGLDGLQVYPLDIGHGNRPGDRELEAYLTEVLDAVRLPCVLSVHQAAGYLHPVELVRRLVERHGQVVGVNVSTGDVQYLARLVDAVGGRVEVHCGGPAHALATLALGGTGFLSSEGNLCPELCVALVDHYNAGRYADAEAAYRRILRLWPIVYGHGSVRGTKAALRLLGLPGGWPRRPRLPVPDEALPEISRLLDELRVRE